jgi:hypothetical protein
MAAARTVDIMPLRKMHTVFDNDAEERLDLFGGESRPSANLHVRIAGRARRLHGSSVGGAHEWRLAAHAGWILMSPELVRDGRKTKTIGGI